MTSSFSTCQWASACGSIQAISFALQYVCDQYSLASQSSTPPLHRKYLEIRKRALIPPRKLVCVFIALVRRRLRFILVKVPRVRLASQMWHDRTIGSSMIQVVPVDAIEERVRFDRPSAP